MSTHRLIKKASIPILTVVVVGTIAYWAYPESLPPLRTAGIIAGWIGTGVLLVSLLLMLREPRIARFFGGLEPMYRWHHLLAVWAYIALLIHPLFLAANALEESPTFAWATLSPWQQGWPVWLGWLSLLFMMAGLFIALSPKLPYASWRRLHHLLSVSVILGSAHLVLLGIYGVLLLTPVLIITFLLWRLIRADHGQGALPFLVERVQHFSSTTVEVTLKPLAKPLNAKPGQFVLSAFLDGPQFDGCSEYHPFTISSIDKEGSIALGIKDLGDCTHHLQSIKAGAEARLQGPFGQFLAELDGPSLWIAGGIGITPFIAALRKDTLPYPVHLIYLHREDADAPYANELIDISATQTLLKLQSMATGESVPDLASLLPNADQLSDLECYLCGPMVLVNIASQLLQQRGVDSSHIHFESFDFR